MRQRIADFAKDARVLVCALVSICFLLFSTGWLSWLYRVTALVDPGMADLATMGAGYLAQAAGIALYMIAARRSKGERAGRYVAVATVLYVFLLEPASLSEGIVFTLVFGWAMNLACGFVQGHYLYCLAALVAPQARGTVFGIGYAVTTLATWLLSSVAEGVLVNGMPCLAVCALLALLVIVCLRFIARIPQPSLASFQPASPSGPAVLPGRTLFVFAGTAVVIVSVVKGAGFSFPSADLSESVDLELSRLFYGIGLIVAGIVADRDRRYLLICCAASLVTPYLLLVLAETGVSSVLLWELGYLLFGFFAVWRVVLFSDLAEQSGNAWLAGAGLGLGRVGDALGTVLCVAFGGSVVSLVVMTTGLFIVSMALLFILFERFYSAYAAAPVQERDVLAEFAEQYRLSERERDVLACLVRRMTNPKIAEELFISEPTVKFHVRNILKKTGCANRVEVADLYAALAEK